jgi:gluconolactonase
VISPDGKVLRQVETGDPMTTNICFGGPDLKTAYITLSGTGQLVAMDWPDAGLKLAHQ